MKKLLYGFIDPQHAIICTLKNITFKGMDITVEAITEDNNIIIAPMEMFKNV